jgi:creatinine amidohydrolase
MSTWNLAEATYPDIQDGSFEVAVLPFGATEPHNRHLPYGTDMFEGNVLGSAICERAHADGAKVLLLPTLPFGTQTNMRDLPFAMNLYPSTLTLIVSDLLETLVRSGICKVLLLNMHGGNEMKSVVRELSPRTDASLFICNWWEVLGEEYHQIFDEPEDHAGEFETSIALARFPELVRDGADDGETRPFRFEAMNRGWVKTSRPWHLLTTNTGSGNPHAASAAKGEEAILLIVNRISTFLVQLSEATLDHSFPFEASS